MDYRIATTKEQSDRLVACGVSPDTADMSLGKDESQPLTLMARAYRTFKGLFKRDYVIPAWSLSALLALLPKEIYDECGDSYFFSLAKEFPLSEEYGAAYIPCWDKGDAIVRKRDDNPIEACTQLIEWIVDNGYKLNAKTEQKNNISDTAASK